MADEGALKRASWIAITAVLTAVVGVLVAAMTGLLSPKPAFDVKLSGPIFAPSANRITIDIIQTSRFATARNVVIRFGVQTSRIQPELGATFHTLPPRTGEQFGKVEIIPPPTNPPKDSPMSEYALTADTFCKLDNEHNSYARTNHSGLRSFDAVVKCDLLNYLDKRTFFIRSQSDEFLIPDDITVAIQIEGLSTIRHYSHNQDGIIATPVSPQIYHETFIPP